MSDSTQGLAVVEKYEQAFNYIYPILVSINNKHRVLRDSTVNHMIDQFSLFYQATKSNQISKIYLADAGLATIKAMMRLLVDSNRRLISKKQYETTQILLSETGRMVGSWIKNKGK